MAEQAVRQARLRPEFAHVYPWLNWGSWETAESVANRVMTWLLTEHRGSIAGTDRVLPSEHFDFRGPSRESYRRSATRPRRYIRRLDSSSDSPKIG
jgi:hypothetical protein